MDDELEAEETAVVEGEPAEAVEKNATPVEENEDQEGTITGEEIDEEEIEEEESVSDEVGEESDYELIKEEEKFKEILGESVGEGEGEWAKDEIEEILGELGESLEEEEGEAEEGPPDPAAPYNLTDSSEALKAPFQLRPDQFEEVKEVWELFQDYTPAYTDIKDYVTEKELVYMLQALNLQTFTPEQLMELIIFCVRPPHPDNHVNFEQFVHIVTIRQRDLPAEEEIRLALQAFDPEKTGLIDREYLREQLAFTGHKMKTVDMFIKEVDISNDGTLGVEDIVGTMCIDLNRDDIDMLYAQINPPKQMDENIDNLI